MGLLIRNKQVYGNNSIVNTIGMAAVSANPTFSTLQFYGREET